MKRPDHEDFCTTLELKRKEFSGIRTNTLTSRIELWVLGTVEKEISQAQLLINPNAVEEAMSEIFLVDTNPNH